MDLQMPVMDGYEASKRIKNIDERQKICAVTAYTKEIC
jgi:CheY-like chemotaxis protein